MQHMATVVAVAFTLHSKKKCLVVKYICTQKWTIADMSMIIEMIQMENTNVDGFGIKRELEG